MTRQFSLFDDGPKLPDGFKYQPALITEADEQELLEHIRGLPFREFEFHGFTGKRRVISFGWKYDFNDRELQKVDDIPGFLLSLRDLAAQFAGTEASAFQHALVTEYGPGAAIGWHKDKSVFGQVIGISLLSACVFRLRRSVGTSWDRVSITAEARSAYLLSGPARTEWEHSIPPVDALRYSITFRNVV
jgi:alkylated DNA repair dioxygenase AlkB